MVRKLLELLSLVLILTVAIQCSSVKPTRGGGGGGDGPGGGGPKPKVNLGNREDILDQVPGVNDLLDQGIQNLGGHGLSNNINPGGAFFDPSGNLVIPDSKNPPTPFSGFGQQPGGGILGNNLPGNGNGGATAPPTPQPTPDLGNVPGFGGQNKAPDGTVPFVGSVSARPIAKVALQEQAPRPSTRLRGLFEKR